MILSVTIPALADEGYTNGSEVITSNVDVIEGTYEGINLDDIDLDGEFAMPTIPVLPDAPPVDGSESDDNPIIEDDEEDYIIAYVPQVPMIAPANITALSTPITGIELSFVGNPTTFYVGETYTDVTTFLPDSVNAMDIDSNTDIGGQAWRPLNVPPSGSLYIGAHWFEDNMVFEEITFNVPGTFQRTIYLVADPTVNAEQTINVVRRDSGGGTVTPPPPVYTPSYTVPLRTGFNSSPAPGSPAFSMHAGMGAANRTVANIRTTASNSTTADDIMNAIRAVLPEGVTAEWSQFNSFNLVPATVETDGLITGFITISAGSGSNRTSTGLRINWIIPALSE